MHVEIVTGLVALGVGLWCVSSALDTCTSKEDCYDVLCPARMVAECTEFNTCKCEHFHGVPDTCTDHQDCHALNCTGHHRWDCVANVCACVAKHQQNCTFAHHHCQNLICPTDFNSVCVNGACTCVAHKNSMA